MPDNQTDIALHAISCHAQGEVLGCPYCANRHHYTVMDSHIKIAHNQYHLEEIKNLMESEIDNPVCGRELLTEAIKSYEARQRIFDDKIQSTEITGSLSGKKKIKILCNTKTPSKIGIVKMQNDISESSISIFRDSVESESKRVNLKRDDLLKPDNNMDATKNYAHPYREHGRFGSHPSHDDFDEEFE